MINEYLSITFPKFSFTVSNLKNLNIAKIKAIYVEAAIDIILTNNEFKFKFSFIDSKKVISDEINIMLICIMFII